MILGIFMPTIIETIPDRRNQEQPEPMRRQVSGAATHWVGYNASRFSGRVISACELIECGFWKSNPSADFIATQAAPMRLF